MGGRAILEGVDEMAEPLHGVFLGEAQCAEHGLLHLRCGDPDGTAAHLGAVEHDVVGLGAAAGLIGFQLLYILVHGGCERMVHGDETVFLLRPLEHGELRDPKKFELPGIEQIQPFGTLAAKRAQGGKDHLVFGVAADQDQVTVLSFRAGKNGAVFFFCQEFLIRRGDLSLVHPGPGQALGLIGFDEFHQLVDLFARERICPALDIDEAHGAACLHGL